jgi:hypothetical protein
MPDEALTPFSFLSLNNHVLLLPPLLETRICIVFSFLCVNKHYIKKSFTASTDHPRAGEVRPGRGRQSGLAPVIIQIGFWARVVESEGPLTLHRSGHVPETGLYSTVTHHTCYSICGPGSFNLDLIGLPLLDSKWGLVLPHLVCDAPCGSWFI